MAAGMFQAAKRAFVKVLLALAVHYSLRLGALSRDSTDEAVLRAYKRVLLRVHPDKGGTKEKTQDGARSAKRDEGARAKRAEGTRAKRAEGARSAPKAKATSGLGRLYVFFYSSKIRTQNNMHIVYAGEITEVHALRVLPRWNR